MQYAIIRSGGKQYKVSAGSTVEMDRLNTSGKGYTFDEVLLLVNDGKVTIGKPTIKGASVLAKLVEEKKGDKLKIVKYKAKVRYRRAMGFRSRLSVVHIDKIESISSRSTEKSDKTAKTAPKKVKKVGKDLV